MPDDDGPEFCADCWERAENTYESSMGFDDINELYRECRTECPDGADDA